MMRMLCTAVATACVSVPVAAKTITLSPVVSATYSGELPPDYDAGLNNCEIVQSADLVQFNMPVGEGHIGAMSGSFFADDRRANFEFGLSGIKGTVKSAKLHFGAYATFNDDGLENCLFGYVGDGAATLDDYLPSKFHVTDFFLEFSPEEGAWLLDAELELTDLVRGFQLASVPYLGLQMVKSSYYDTVIEITGVRLVIETIPEPTTLALFGLGLAGLGIRRRQPKA